MWILFDTKSHEHKQSIAKQVANKVDEDTFLRVWDFATKDSKHDALVVDYKAPSIDFMFRKGFDKLIRLSDEKEVYCNDIKDNQDNDGST